MDVDVLLRANHAHTFMIAVSAFTPIFPFEYLPTADAHWCCNMMGIFFLNLVRALSNHFTYFRPLPSSDNIIWYSAFSRSINFHFEFTFPLELCIIMPQLNWTIINDSYKNGIMYIRTEQQNNEKKMVSERKVGTKYEDAPHQAAGGTTIEKTENSSERCRRWWWRRMLSSKVDGGWFDMMYLYSIYVHACARHNLKQS